MGDIVKLHTPVPSVVAALRGLLQAAESGEIIGIAFAAEFTGGRAAIDYEQGDAGARTLIGDVQILVARMSEDFLDTHEES